MDKRHTVVIGGTRGLGREVVNHFVRAEHDVSVIARNQPAVDRLLDIHYFSADITNSIALEATLCEVLRYRQNINNLIFVQRYRSNVNDLWSGELRTALSATKNIVDFFTDKFSNSSNNSIVMVSSITGKFIETQPVGYHVAKAAIDALVRYYAVVLGKTGIRVNAVSPAPFLKEETKQYYMNNKSLLELYGKITPLGRMCTAYEVAQVIAFLCSEAASFVTGQNILVDGGMSLVQHDAMAKSLLSISC